MDCHGRSDVACSDAQHHCARIRGYTGRFRALSNIAWGLGGVKLNGVDNKYGDTRLPVTDATVLKRGPGGKAHTPAAQLKHGRDVCKCDEGLKLLSWPA